MDQTMIAVASRSRRHARLLHRILGAIAMQRSRHHLRDLDDHLLRDLGLTRGQALRESERPNWNAPAHWLR